MNNKIVLTLFLSILFFIPSSYAQSEHKGSQGNQEQKGSQGNQDHKGSQDGVMAPKDVVKEEDHGKDHVLEPIKDNKGNIAYYTCGMHPSVRFSVESYEKGDTTCPICSMPLTPVVKGKIEDETFDENIISKVEIRARELKLAGVKTEKIKKRTLYKEIRSVGNVAYDPNLAIAQDEFLSAIRSYEKAVKGGINEIVVRAKSLVDSSRRKLLLLGLSNEQIDDIEKYKESQDNLILPGDKMWVYGYAYEYELNWIKKGSDVKVKSIGLIGEEFYGEIISINPTVDPQTRSVKFRALIDNPSKQLKPDMYVDIEIMSEYRDPQGNMEVLSIPKSALLDTGRRKVVWVDLGGGQFEGRKIVVGPEAVEQSEEQGKFYPVLKGLKEGDVVVTKGNFLIDSQSQITGVAASAYGGAIGDEEPKGSFQGLHTGH